MKFRIKTLVDAVRDQENLAESLAVLGDAPGAYPSGTRVRKINSDETDAHPNGSLATVRGSECLPADLHATHGEFFYCVEWDDLPGVPVHVQSNRLAVAP